MGTTECYYFTVPRSARLQREWEAIVNRITGMNDSSNFLYLNRVLPDEQTSKKIQLEFLYLAKVNRKDTSLSESIAELSDIFGCKVKLQPITGRSAPKEVLDALPIAKKVMFASNGTHIRGEAERCLVLETPDELCVW